MQCSCKTLLLFLSFDIIKNDYTSLDSQGWMLHNDLKYVNVANKIEVHTTLEFNNCNFQYIFLNLIISVNHGAKVTKFGKHVVKDHSEGSVSQIVDLGLSFLF